MEEGQAAPRTTQLLARGTWIALLLALPLILCLGVGFLADDYYIIRAIHEFREAGPSLWSELTSGVGRVWTPDFDIFRPLTILTLQLDSLLLPGAAWHYHLTNWVLWVCLAWTAASVANPKGRPDERLPWFGFMVVSPAAMEALGWIVAREDLLVAIFSGLAIRSALDRPSSISIILWCALALSAKETGIVLIPLLGLLVVLAPRRSMPRSAVVRQLALLGLTAGAWFAARYLIHGELSGTYNGRPYLSYLREPGALLRTISRVIESLSRVVAPLNDAAWSEFVPWIPASLFRTTLGLALGLLVVGGWRKSVPNFRTTVAAAGLIFLPLLLLCVPLEGIGEDQDQSRFACLPLLGLSLIAGPGTATVLRRPGLARMAWLALVLLSAIALFVSFRPYRQVTRIDTKLVDSLVRSAGDLPCAVVVDLDPGNRGGGIHPQLLSYQGVHRLSGGLFSATLPPFRSHPGIRLLPWSSNVATVLASTQRELDARCAVMRLSGDGAHISFLPILTDPADHPALSAVATWNSESLEVRIRSRSEHAGEIIILALDSVGRQAIASLPEREAQRLQSGEEISVSGDSLRLTAIDPPVGLTPSVLALVQGPGLWIQAQARDRGGQVRGRSLIQFLPRPQ